MAGDNTIGWQDKQAYRAINCWMPSSLQTASPRGINSSLPRKALWVTLDAARGL